VLRLGMSVQPEAGVIELDECVIDPRVAVHQVAARQLGLYDRARRGAGNAHAACQRAGTLLPRPQRRQQFRQGDVAQFDVEIQGSRRGAGPEVGPGETAGRERATAAGTSELEPVQRRRPLVQQQRRPGMEPPRVMATHPDVTDANPGEGIRSAGFRGFDYSAGANLLLATRLSYGREAERIRQLEQLQLRRAECVRPDSHGIGMGGHSQSGTATAERAAFQQDRHALGRGVAIDQALAAATGVDVQANRASRLRSPPHPCGRPGAAQRRARH
jgi:hypothetical protein